MTWNLWNVVRHYAYIRYFKNENRELGDNIANWEELERLTRRLVKGIYRSYKEKTAADTFGSVDNSLNRSGGPCLVKWTNSFIEIQSIFDRNAREHEASFVLFTGDYRINVNAITSGGLGQVYRKTYEDIQSSQLNFRVATLDGVDSEKDGMSSEGHVYHGKKPKDMPTKYVVGDAVAIDQRQSDVEISMSPFLDLDMEYPYSEYYLNDSVRRWVRRITRTTMNRQVLPVYTSMETMNKDVHKLTDEEMKDITFQVIPQMYWKYEWTYNEIMIHPVGKLKSPNSFEMYDMLGNVWEWVRDDWTANVSALNGRTNPIAVATGGSNKKVIKGGAFDQYCRKTISPSREGLECGKNQSQYGTQANVGFRPSLTYTHEVKPIDPGSTPVDLFFLFDASASTTDELGRMVESANKIANYFADDEDPDKCHVGSALYLGP